MSTERKAVSYSELFPGRFVKADLLNGREVTVTVASVNVDDLPTEKGTVEKRGIVRFRETERALVLNRTNAECLKAMFGPELAAWEGKRVTLYPTKARLGPETVDAIRVRGSPDLAADLTFELRLPRKKPTRVTLTKTVAAPETKD